MNPSPIRLTAPPRPVGAPRPRLLAASRAAAPPLLEEYLDLLPVAAATLDALGRLTSANQPLRRMLDDADAGRALAAELTAAARDVLTAPYAGDLLEASTDDGLLVIRGRRVRSPQLAPGAAVVLLVHPAPESALVDERVRRHFRLTATQARVAVLLSEGLSNRALATRLCVSPHTARHHTDHVFTKLNVHRRAEVGPALRRARAHA